MIKPIRSLLRGWVVAHELFHDRLLTWDGDVLPLGTRR